MIARICIENGHLPTGLSREGRFTALAIEYFLCMFVFRQSRYPEIQASEESGALHEGDVLFKALSEEFYRMVYGKDEADRKLTYQG